MICLSMRSTVLYPEDEDVRVTGISLPDWDEVVGARLLRSITYSETSVFNSHLLDDLLDDLLGELDLWQRFEIDGGDANDRVRTIEQVRQAIAASQKLWDRDSGSYAIFSAAAPEVER